MSDSNLLIIQDAWHRYVKGDSLDVRHLRTEIANSWQRCRNLNIDPHAGELDAEVDALQLKERLYQNQRLLRIARPVMERLYAFVRGTGFQVVLTDETGFLLDVLGDSEITSRTKRVHLCPGGDWSETSQGTNAIGTAIFERKPIQIYASEHYCEANHFLVCSACPIFDVDGQMVGVLDLSGDYHFTTPHTLGMVVAAVGAIENQLRLQRATEKLYVAYRYSSTLLESMSDGLISIDNNGIITEINAKGANIFGLDPRLAKGRHIGQVFSINAPVLNLLMNGGAVYEGKEISLDRLGKKIRSSGSLLRDDTGAVIGAVAVFHEIASRKTPVKRQLRLPAKHYKFDDIVSESASMIALKAWAEQAAASSSTVLIQGESGTGKELFAQAIHNASPRRDCPFVALNCAAMPEGLIESELFGYEEGSFTGAKKGGQSGKFEMADGGTLFLDEIGDMSLNMQMKVLRVIQEKKVARVGSSVERDVDIRIIAATHKDLEEEVRCERFRHDLYYRLHVLDVRIPPLRERVEDIPELAHRLIGRLAERRWNKPIQVESGFLKKLQTYSWPGNVRELENAIERALIRAGEEGILREEFLDIDSRPISPKVADVAAAPAKSLRDSEIEMIGKVLANCRGNIQKAAVELGIGRNTLYRKMKEYGIQSQRS